MMVVAIVESMDDDRTVSWRPMGEFVHFASNLSAVLVFLGTGGFMWRYESVSGDGEICVLYNSQSQVLLYR